MNKRIYGLIAIKAIRTNWNADFTHRPRTTVTGEIFGSDKALKYAIRKYWYNEGEKVFYFRSLNENMNPNSIIERYESLFTPLADGKGITDVLTNLFTTIDVENFGGTFTAAKNNASITGAVQIGQGINLNSDSHIETLDILSAFRNPNENKDGSEKTQTTKGEMVIADDVRYVYPFSVNPSNYNEFAYIDGFKGYTDKAYESFKIASRIAVTAMSSNTKFGCDNEFTLFIELKDKSKTYLPSLIDYVKFTKGEKDEKDIYDLSNLSFIQEVDTEILSVEIYYNPYTIKLEFCLPVFKNKVKLYNIFSGKQL